MLQSLKIESGISAAILVGSVALLKVGMIGIGDKPFTAVDNVLFTLLLDRGLDIGCIRRGDDAWRQSISERQTCFVTQRKH